MSEKQAHYNLEDGEKYLEHAENPIGTAENNLTLCPLAGEETPNTNANRYQTNVCGESGMSEVAHTPGPWEISEGARVVWILADGDEIAIALAGSAQARVALPAHAMAAAPELLAACESALTNLNACHEDCCEGCNTCLRVLPQLKAAIAKATGETP